MENYERLGDANESPFIVDDLISVYSRAQAIADGTLIDVSDLAKRVGFIFPVAITKSVFIDCVEWSSEANRRKDIYTSQKQRLVTLLRGAMAEARKSPSDVIHYVIKRIPEEGRSSTHGPVKLKAMITPGDTLDPVITIMGPGED